jgi:CubicO group peptidase (beta-lactamase class C family)
MTFSPASILCLLHGALRLIFAAFLLLLLVLGVPRIALAADSGAAATAIPALPQRAQVAVTFDAKGRIAVRVAEGPLSRANPRAVTADDAARVASVSKLVVALGVMRLVEAGKLDLDADVSRYLGWELRHPQYPGTPITLAMLLGHRSGVSGSFDYLLPLDAELPAKLGEAGAFDADRAPGGAFAYSNLNYPIIAAAMEGATGERFDRLIHQLVFAPLNIDACFNWTMCSADRLAGAVALYRANGELALDENGGKMPPCPTLRASDGGCDLGVYKLARHGAAFSPQGGMRISARDLARIGVMLLQRGRGFLKPSSIARLERLEAVNPDRGEGAGGLFCSFGLAVHATGGGDLRKPGCKSDLFGDGRLRTGHSGDAYGLRAGLWIDRRRGSGIAYFVTAVPPEGVGARSAYGAEEEALVSRAMAGTARASKR